MEDDLQLARRAALAGAEVGLRYFAALAGLRRERKIDGSVVTEADRAVEAAIGAILTAARPGDAILGEEGGAVPAGVVPDGGGGDPPGGAGGAGGAGGSGGAGGAGGGGGPGRGPVRRRWIIDPIDGTALFVEGDDRWLVLLALEDDGEIVAGVAVVPARGRIWWARRGSGAFEASTGDLAAARRIRVADGEARLGLSLVPALIDPATGENTVPYRPEVVAGLPPARPWDLHPPLLVARGDRDLAVQTSGQVWDFAATSLIVEEAGGVYSGLAGNRRPAAGPSLFARSPRVRDDTLRTLGRPDASAREIR